MDRRQLAWLFFGFSGRIGRLVYFLAGLLVAIVTVLPYYRSLLVPEGSSAHAFWSNIFFVVFALSVLCNITLSVKRLHDLGKPGIFVLVLFIPIVSIVALVALYLMPGEAGPNRYGERPDVAPEAGP